MRKELTAERLRELLDYDPETGVFTWKLLKGSARPGVAALSKRKGYVRIKVDRVVYPAHRLAWLYVNGEWPSGPLDHRNRDRADNRIANLRLATLSENQHNRSASSRSGTGVKGVYLDRKRGGYQVSIAVGRKTIFLGRCKTIEDGVALYQVGVAKHHGEFGRTK